MPSLNPGHRNNATELVREIAPRLYRYGVVRLGSILLAEEAVAETLCRLIEKGPDLAGPHNHVRGWCVRSMVNICREIERRRPFAISIERAPTRETARPLMRFERSITTDDADRDLLIRSICALSERQREAVTLRILIGLTVAEAAAAMNCAEGTVRALTHQGLASLRAKLGGVLELAG